MLRLFNLILSISILNKLSTSYHLNRSISRLFHINIKMNTNDNLISNSNSEEIFDKNTNNNNYNNDIVIDNIDTNTDTNDIKDNDSNENKLIQLWSDRIQISIKKSRKIKGGNYVQIATVDKYNKPHCRTVVFRGFTNIVNNGIFPSKLLGMKMITDSRSDKIEHIQYSSACEMVWWFSQSSEQYRISGNVLVVSDTTEDLDLLQQRKQQWGNLSDMAREQFYWLNPSEIYTNSNESNNNNNSSSNSSSAINTAQKDTLKGGRDENNILLPPPNTFLLLILIPEKVKYLRLKDNYAQFDEFIKNEWISYRVNP